MDEPRELIKIGFQIELFQDFAACYRRVDDEEDPQFWRRMAVRSFFGYIESWMAVSRNFFIEDILNKDAHDFAIPEDEKGYVDALLKATSSHEWTLQENGTGKRTVRKLRLLPTFKANLRLAWVVSGVRKNEADEHFKLPVWKKIQEVIRLRDRLTHPQKHEDITVSDADIDTFNEAFAYIARTINDLKYPKGEARYTAKG